MGCAPHRTLDKRRGSRNAILCLALRHSRLDPGSRPRSANRTHLAASQRRLPRTGTVTRHLRTPGTNPRWPQPPRPTRHRTHGRLNIRICRDHRVRERLIMLMCSRAFQRVSVELGHGSALSATADSRIARRYHESFIRRVRRTAASRRRRSAGDPPTRFTNSGRGVHERRWAR